MVPKNCGQLQGEKAEVRHITHQRDDEPGKGSKELEDDYFSGVTLGEKKRRDYHKLIERNEEKNNKGCIGEIQNHQNGYSTRHRYKRNTDICTS